VTKPGTSVALDAQLDVDRPRPFVSRGGEKLDAALEAFGINVAGMQALDVGASTGGFTDCLLRRGVAHVVALDVGYGQLAWSLREDRRVTVLERTNFRKLSDDAFTEGFDLIVVDASFISLRTILRRAVTYLREVGTIVALFKPQFEAGRARVPRGVVRDPQTHRDVLQEFRRALSDIGLGIVGAVVSPLRGPAGNVEFFFELKRAPHRLEEADLDRLVAEAHG
jgi:23S rRNA (cytidine1920-2'-O)/16S rRNA (cytidine1409-2'-O)-methyltransferase